MLTKINFILLLLIFLFVCIFNCVRKFESSDTHCIYVKLKHFFFLNLIKFLRIDKTVTMKFILCLSLLILLTTMMTSGTPIKPQLGGRRSGFSDLDSMFDDQESKFSGKDNPLLKTQSRAMAVSDGKGTRKPSN